MITFMNNCKFQIMIELIIGNYAILLYAIHTIIVTMLTQPVSDEQQTIIGDSSYYFCDCGAEFMTYPQYCQHKLKHNQEDKQMDSYSLVKQEQDYAQDNQQLAHINLVSLPAVSKAIKKETKGNHNIKSKQINIASKCSIKKYSKIFQIENIIEWNGYILTKNYVCKTRPYFCGSCQAIFTKIGKYVLHCIQQCQLLVHRNSSHFIKLNSVNQKIQQISIKAEKDKKQLEDPSNNFKKQQTTQNSAVYQPSFIQNLQHEIQDMKPFREILRKKLDHRQISFIQYEQKAKNITNNTIEYQPLQRQLNSLVMNVKQAIDHFEPIYQILKNKMDHSYLPFYCGSCERIFIQKIGYLTHVQKTHKGFVQPSSSHTLLQCFANNRRALIYISTTQEWVNSDPKYFCPCSKSTKVTMKQLIQHVMEQHQGISPIYHILKKIKPKPKEPQNDLLKVKKQRKQALIEEKDNDYQQPQSKQDENWNQDTDQLFQNIKYIYYYELDHKDIASYCEICKKQFTEGILYWKHHIKTHNSTIIPSSSHIVLQIHDKWHIYNLYLTSKVKWMHDEALYYCPCNKSQKMAMKSLITHIFENHNGVSPIYNEKSENMNVWRDQRLSRIKNDPIYMIKTKNQDHRNVSFQCGPCNITFKSGLIYKYHMKQIHKGEIDETSSHIILKVIRSKRNYIFISAHLEWEITESIYYCSCNRQQKMTMDLLVKHVFDNHKGISPLYYFHHQKNCLPYSSQPKNKEESNSQKQEVINQKNDGQVDPILHIAQKNIDHAGVIPFDCHSCNKIFDSKQSYIDHLLDVDHQQDSTSCSHVIFRTSSGRITLYISPRIEWEDKREVYYCPCQPDNKATMKELLQHHITAHNFITPTYELSPIDEA